LLCSIYNAVAQKSPLNKAIFLCGIDALGVSSLCYLYFLFPWRKRNKKPRKFRSPTHKAKLLRGLSGYRASSRNIYYNFYVCFAER
jgi:hypothetical protein